MSSGPEHYREAERLLAACAEFAARLPHQSPMNEVQSANDAIRNTRLEAQAHATLALTAATMARGPLDDVDWPEWNEALK